VWGLSVVSVLAAFHTGWHESRRWSGRVGHGDPSQLHLHDQAAPWNSTWTTHFAHDPRRRPPARVL